MMMMVVMMVMIMMMMSSFWIKPEAVPARVTLGVTSLLTLSTQHANSQKSLPPVSYIKVTSSSSIMAAMLHCCTAPGLGLVNSALSALCSANLTKDYTFYT